MKPVSKGPRRKPSASQSFLRKATLVCGPATSVSPSAAASRSSASSRVAPVAMILAIMGS